MSAFDRQLAQKLLYLDLLSHENSQAISRSKPPDFYVLKGFPSFILNSSTVSSMFVYYENSGTLLYIR
jgi:hypothetical protein